MINQPAIPSRKAPNRLSAPLNAALPYLLIAAPLLLVGLLVIFPAIQSFIRTLIGSGEDVTGGLSLTRYVQFFQDKASVNNLIFTIQVTVISVIALFAICLPLSIYLRFSRSRLTSWVQGIALFPLFVPGIILGYALIQFVGPRGTVPTILQISGLRPLVDNAYQLLFGLRGYRTPYLRPEGIVIGLVWESIPFTVMVLTSGLAQIDNALIESARDVGANRFQVFRQIIFPLVQRPLMIAFCLNFIGIFGSYTLPYLLGPASPQMMGVSMQRTYSEFQEARGAETQAVITFLMCLVVGLLYVRTIVRQRSDETRNPAARQKNQGA